MSAEMDPVWFRGRVAASQGTGGSGGGKVDDTQQRLGALESSTTEVRADVSAIKATLPHLATKADLQQMRAELKEDIGGARTELNEKVGGLRAEIHAALGALKAELKADSGALETRMIGWFVGTAISLVVAVCAVQRYLA